MLGLGNSLSASSASIHEQMYSLDLDGVLDRLVLGDVLDFGTNDFVISLWHKVADYSVETAYLINKHEDDNNKWYISQIDDGTFGVVVINGGNTTLNDVTADASALEGTWVNIIVVCDRSSATGAVIYVNGATTLGKSAFAPDDDDSPENVSITADLTIGSKTGGANAILGKIDEVAIWNVALDAYAVAAVYNSGKPFDLTFDRSSYDNSKALQGYWRMGNGTFDDKVNGVVHDQYGLGVEMVTNGDMGSATGWNHGSYGANVNDTVSGEARVTIDGSGTIAQLTQSLTYHAGETYRATFSVKGSTTNKIACQDNASNTGGLIQSSGDGDPLTLTTSYVTHSHTWVANGNSNCFNIKRHDASETSWTFDVDNVSVKRIGAGFATDVIQNGNFTGVTQAENTDGGSAPNWVTQAGCTIASGKVSWDASQSGTSHCYQKAVGGTTLGTTWKCTATVSDYVAGYLTFSPGGYDYSPTPAITSNGTHVKYVQVTNASSNTNLYLAANSAGNFSVTDVVFEKLNGYPGIAAADATFSTDTPDD